MYSSGWSGDVKFGANDGAAVFVNGVRVHEDNRCSNSKAKELVDVTLNPGPNVIVVKVRNSGVESKRRGHGFMLKFPEELLPALSLSLERPGAAPDAPDLE
uniref:Beta-galactosidase n=3 Tax=Phaeomonas parva TaxID=124430 RepID=A0A7S1TVC7_9STRA|mmetsp:Transcript_16596/g.50966  ORF Transcript_16596/g.50966 Transcript_16596/m.50966 type:complete len:101 (+) Transcript_16596:179-481(+)